MIHELVTSIVDVLIDRLNGPKVSWNHFGIWNANAAVFFQDRHEIDERKAVERAAGKQVEVGSSV